MLFEPAHTRLNGAWDINKAQMFLLRSLANGRLNLNGLIRHTIVQLRTPPEMRGRVAAVNLVFIGASNELGAFESGMVAQAIGTSATVIGGGVATIAVVGIWWFAFPSLRTIDRFEELERHPDDSS